MPRARRAALGGTFDRIHDGHRALLRAAFRAAQEVRIGLTTRSFLRRHPKPLVDRIRSFEFRRRELGRFLQREFRGRTWTILPLNDRYGGAVEPGVDLLVVSEETLGGGRAINRERQRRGLRPLKLLVVPMVRGEDLRTISGRRLREGSIDPAGRRKTPIRVAVTASDPARIRELEAAFSKEFGGIRVRWSRRPWPASRSGPGLGRTVRIAARSMRKKAEYSLAIASVGRFTYLAADEPEGTIGVLRGSSRAPGSIASLVHRLFGGRGSARERDR